MRGPNLRAAAPAALALLLAGCIPPPAQTVPAPAPRPTLTPAATPPPVVAVAPVPAQPDWRHATLTAGDWRYRRSGTQSFAEFVSPRGATLVQFTCTGAREIVLAIDNGFPAASGVTVRTETQERQLITATREGWVETRLAAQDPLLDAIAFSRGRVALEVAGGNALYVPPYPEITRVVEDCR